MAFTSVPLGTHAVSVSILTVTLSVGLATLARDKIIVVVDTPFPINRIDVLVFQAISPKACDVPTDGSVVITCHVKSSSLLTKSRRVSASHAINVCSHRIAFFICEGRADNDAPVSPVSVSASNSACVVISTLPAVVVSALKVVPVAKLVHEPDIYCWRIQRAVLYTTIPFAGEVIATSRAVVSAYTGTLSDFVVDTFHENIIFPVTVHHSCLSIIWSCISTSSIEVHAGNVVPVTVVAGSAVCDTKVTPVRVVPVTPVYLIQACVFPL